MADRPHPSSIAGGPYDGTTFSYIPGPTLNIDPSLTLHREWTDKIDPITYEVIRHNLWNINEELGMTIQRISGSPVAMYAFDLNSSIFTEDGEFIYYGPYQLYMSGVSDVQVKWTLEHRSKNPGIHEDDMFLSNDPWVGAAHQMDVTLLTPVFHEGKLFCWITNVLHQYDVGGITPGSFCPSARDAFDEGILIPPVKIVERGELRKDIEGVYLRASRKPYLVALDLRAQIAGNNTAKKRILGLIQRYGADVVKGVMRKIIDNAEAAFVAKLAKVPDGTWRERSYVEVAYVGDRKTYQVMLTMRKQGDKLIFDNAGTRRPGGRHQHHVLRLARLAHDRDQRAAVLGPALRHRRRAAAHRVPAGAGLLHLGHAPGLGLDGARAGDGDLALSRLQHDQQDAVVRPRAEEGRDDHRRDVASSR